MQTSPTHPEKPLPAQEGLDLAQRKREIRRQAQANRNAQPNKDELSRQIVARCMALPEYAAADTVMFYVDVRSEVRTRHDLAGALGSDKKTIAPYCVGGELELFHLESIDELETGMYQVLEPKAQLRTLPHKRVKITDLDLIVTPGVAFDRQGGRIGHGMGYYDKLLRHARQDTTLVALAFECQMFSQVPVGPHDVIMDYVVTQRAVYHGSRIARCDPDV